jgi:predicted unusual protein kinase regulating ubiquinone biosynthesis (AarF/ABC1/UbiB family)
MMEALLRACVGEAPATERAHAVAKVLQSGGQCLRKQIGDWVADSVSVDQIVPEIYAEWRPLVRNSIQFLFARLSASRLAAKLVDQVDLPLDTLPSRRLMTLIAKMPAIQKMGQVLARHRHLGEPLSKALSELENGMSDVEPDRIHALITKQLGSRLRKYTVELEAGIFAEASVSAVVRFTWKNPKSKARERGVFKVLKPHVPRYFAEDLRLLQGLSDAIARKHDAGFASRHVAEMVSEVRLLLEHELDFPREQTTLADARRTYRLSLGIRIPHLIAALSTPAITAMSEEDGVKITDAFPGDPNRRRLVAEQLIEALISVPLLSRDAVTVFHADPHAGNILYDERHNEVVILDWALTERLDRELRRHVALLVMMMMLRNQAGVTEAIERLSAMSVKTNRARSHLIADRVAQYFRLLTGDHSPGSLDAMRLLDRIALEGVRFPATLAMFQKAIFTLDDLLYDLAGSKVSISSILIRDFVAHLVASLGLDHPPLSVQDLIALPKSALLYPARWGASALLGARPVTS